MIFELGQLSFAVIFVTHFSNDVGCSTLFPLNCKTWAATDDVILPLH